MLRAYNNLPSIASPAISICALKLSLRQALNSTSSSSSRRISTTFPLLSQTFTSSTSFLGLKRVMRMRNRPPLRASASYSTGNSHDVGREILVQHLLLKEEDKNIFLELQKRLVQGEDLSDLAVEYSICPSKEEGGMLGWVRKGQMVPEFEEAAFNAPVNKVVKCKTQFGWHLLQVLSEREESVLQDIQPEELHTKLQDPDFLEDAQFIDVREPHEVERAYLSGFQVLPLQQFGSWGPEVTTKLDPQKDTYVLCHHGVRSLQVAKWLQTQGFRKIYNISGGIHAYAVKADPSIPTY
ncbi:rhodanese-like/PpiC domain-containing protein 12, chloroplastic isoform X2 [Cynara cardunculus var. scolymus]|uniref:rhodanese-like/PpiC domain-containing protein 12, chloroplastic isoform X2 n=1 Tax=Cynara cardunculus var. scolymus TaxID=59895 RepID=UPI000D629F49|nr:rhodanese-like/PpiC domain-containing protein 12, chloroplastic isoform X2 [Cynara cardunculus var. scolymus]